MFATVFPSMSRGIYPLKSCVLVSQASYTFLVNRNGQLSLFQSHKGDVSFANFKSNTICMQELGTKAYYQIDKNNMKNLTKSEAEGYLQKNVKEFDNWRVTTQYADFILDPSTYHFKNTRTGKINSLTSEGHLLTIVNDFIYFNMFKENHIVKYNVDLEQVDCKVFDKHSKRKDYINGLTFTYIPKENPRIEVFDLASFETLQVLPLPTCKGSRMIWNLVKTDELIVFTCGDTTYGWDGSQLNLFFVGKKVSSIVDKGKFVYICFKNDPTLYAYSTDLTTLMHKQDSLVEGYYLQDMTSQEDQNFAHFWQCDCPKVKGLEYFVSWNDEEFFSKTLTIAQLEAPIFEELQVPEGDNFSLQINVQVGDDYGTVARQSLAALGEALDVHSYYADRTDEEYGKYSEHFTGAIEMRFINSKQLNKEQQEQLLFACKNIRRAYVNNKGAATGDHCTVAYQFV